MSWIQPKQAGGKNSKAIQDLPQENGFSAATDHQNLSEGACPRQIEISNPKKLKQVHLLEMDLLQQNLEAMHMMIVSGTDFVPEEVLQQYKEAGIILDRRRENKARA